MKPVYVINGFLESGKTEFITYTLSQPYFKIAGKTLLILCEEGENEYDEELLKKSKTIIAPMDSLEDCTPEALMELDKQFRPERIIIEWNGMWNAKEMKLPMTWTVEQQITIIDASTFPTYFNNMKSLLAEMLRKSEMIIFNRCDGNKELSSYKRNVKAINQNADIIFEDSRGEVNEIMEEELPYDLKAEVIDLDNEGYGIWYLDSLDHLERYDGKVIRFQAMVMRPKRFKKGYFIPGRMAMTCCAEDMTFLGFACSCDKVEELKEKSWITLTARVHKQYFSEYKGEGPVLEAINIEPSTKPENDIISFS